jgi:hypothetical protein
MGTLLNGLMCLVAAGLAPPAGGGPTLDDIIARHVAARGGAARIKALQSVRMIGKATTGAGRRALVTREVKRPGRVRMEFAFQGMTGVYAWDGEHGWQVSPLDGSLDPQPLSAENADLAVEQCDIEGPLVDWKAKGHTVELVGREKVGDQEAFKLKLTLESGAVRYEFLDTQSYLVVKTEVTRVVRGHAVDLETRFGDYKEVGGLRFPHSIESGARGRPRKLSVVVETIELNPVLDEARFRMPEAAASP